MRPRVLVVDDCEITRVGLAQVLRNAGFDVVPAADGAEALAYLQAGNVAHLILLDAVMPIMNGWAFRRAQMNDPWLADIPVIAVSAVDSHGTDGLHASATLHKPLDPAILVQTIHAMCFEAERRRRASRVRDRCDGA